MVADNVVQTWLEMNIEDKAVAQDGLVLNVRRRLGFFYTDGGMIRAR